MVDKDDPLLRRLMPIFQEEAQEHISGITAGLTQLRSAEGAERSTLIEIVFRQAHSLKAAAHAVGQTAIEQVCHSLESVFAALKRTELAPSTELVAALEQASDELEELLATLNAAADPRRELHAAEVAGRIDLLLATIRAGPEASVADRPKPPPAPPINPLVVPPTQAEAPEPQGAAPAAPVADTVRLSVHRLDALLLQAEEMLAEKLAARQLATQTKELIGLFRTWKTGFGQARASMLGRPDPRRPLPPEKATQQVADFVAYSERFARTMEAQLAGLDRMAASEARGLGAKVDRLLFDLKHALTLPCGSMLQLLPRTVRELARDQGKDVAFAMTGVDLEMDRHILQELKDPLLHLLRNCVDHGVETPVLRRVAGKPPRATIALDVSAGDGNKATFTIRDDGAGISPSRLAEAAVKLGLLSADHAAQRVAAQDPELLQLIFQSGVSTSPMITDVSGRGIGLAIVRERMERLGGTVTVQSVAGQGTSFQLSVPLSLATYRGIVIRVADRPFVLPTLGVNRVVAIDRSRLSTVENRPVLDHAGGPIPLVLLQDILELPSTPRRPAQGAYRVAVVIGTMGRRVALEVDAIDGDQEILVKPLGPYLVRVRNVQGATLLANGAIAPILNIHDLLQSAAKAVRETTTGAVSRDGPAPQSRSILLVEDSITARVLLRSILESAGYRVTTAVDGMDAWTTINLERFDLVVSDVEMPRMNGFELTARIRSMPGLKDLPVILVTALGSSEDRERGADSGANAYIAKGGFDHNHLLDAVRRLA